MPIRHVRVAVLVAFALSVGAFGSHRSARAYELLGGQWPGISSLGFCISSSYSGSDAAWDTGLYYWDYLSSEFGYHTSCNGNKVSLLDANYSQVSWDGLAELIPSPVSNPYTGAAAYLNYHHIQDYTTTKIASVAGHELGHIFGLAHESGCVLMNAATSVRYTSCGVWYATSDDRDGVSYIY